MSFYTAIDDLTSDYNIKEKKLQQFQNLFPESSKTDLLGFLRFRDYNLEEAELQYRNTLAWRKNCPKPTIVDVASFIMVPSGSSGPDGCCVLLEDGKGDCARDKLGRPIVLHVGMPHGNRYEVLLQALYTTNRIAQYIQPGQLPTVTMVMECIPRKGAIGTFRFPDEGTKALFNLQREHFPGGLDSTSHLCGVPTVAVWAFHLVKPFMPAELFKNIQLRTDFRHLPEFISKENILEEWGGSFKFDFNSYVKWRADEENVSHLLSSVLVRRYDPKSQEVDLSQIQIKAGFEGLIDLYSRYSYLTAYKLANHLPAVAKFGVLWKVGSGKGFSAVRWTRKLMFIGGPAPIVVYFDVTDVNNNTAKPVEVLSLAAVFVSPLSDSAGLSGNQNYRYRFQIRAPSRNLQFGCESCSDRDAWINKFQMEIKKLDFPDQSLCKGDDTKET